jgi:hypothetical protein|tara:strand:- start:939 stop:1160 length:222 start_codon:yes stop_codon:yes gene_type:complete
MKIQSDLDRLMEQVGCKLRTYRENDGLKKGEWGSSAEYREFADQIHSLATLIDADIMEMDDAEGVDIEERLAI